MSYQEIALAILIALQVLVYLLLYWLRPNTFPGLGTFKAIVLLAISRVLDDATFFWALDNSRGRVVKDETNMIFQFLIRLLPPVEAMVVTIVTGLLLFALIVFFLWKGGNKRVLFAVVGGYTSFSLVAAFANVNYVLRLVRIM